MKKNNVTLRPGMKIMQIVSGVGPIKFTINSVWTVNKSPGAIAGTWFSLSADGYDPRIYCIPTANPTDPPHLELSP